MKYKIIRGKAAGHVVELAHLTGNYVKVEIEGKTITVATKDLNPIFEIGDIVSIKGIGEMRYKIISKEGQSFFLTPTRPQWGEGRLMFPETILEPAELNLQKGDKVIIIGNPDVVFRIQKTDNSIAFLECEAEALNFSLPFKFLEKA